MSSADYFYPFDGKCTRSKDADLTLTFDDKSSLKFSKCLLELVSPVIKTAIEESQHYGTVHLPKTSHDVWLLILNYIHPAGKSVACVESIITSGWELLADVLRQCDKYELVSLKEDIDERQAKALDEKRARAIEAFHPVLNGETIVTEFHYPLVDLEMDVFKAIKVFSLPRSEEAVVSYLLNIGDVLDECDKRWAVEGYKPTKRDFDITDICFASIVRDMHEAGRHRFGSLMLTTMIEKAQKKKTINLKAETMKIPSEKTQDNKFQYDVSENKKALYNVAENKKASYDVAENKKASYDVAENKKALYDVAHHKKTQNEKTHNKKTSNDKARNKKTLNDKAVSCPMFSAFE